MCCCWESGSGCGLIEDLIAGHRQGSASPGNILQTPATAIHSMDDEKKFPEVQGGGSLILAWQIRNKRVLVVGGGEVRIQLLDVCLYATN